MYENLENEKWKVVPGYENYEISSMGRLKNLKFNKMLNGCLHKASYNKDKTRRMYSLYNEEGLKKLNAARWMAITFLDLNINDRNQQADHINNDSMDDRLENIQVISQRENLSKDRINKSGFLGVYPSGNKFLAKIQIDGKCNYIGVYPTAEEASEVYQTALAKLN